MPWLDMLVIGEACGEVGEGLEVLVGGFSVDIVLLAELVMGGLGGMMTSSVLFLGLPGEGCQRPYKSFSYHAVTQFWAAC